MKKAQNIGKSIVYKLEYSNFTFELWVLLHKSDCNSSMSHRSQYIKQLNRAYSVNFEDLHQYKHQDNFERILGQLTLDHVKNAVKRSELCRNLQHFSIFRHALV